MHPLLALSYSPIIIRYIFGTGGDSPNVLATAARLATSAARGSTPPPEPGLLRSLCRDREHRSKVVVDRLSIVSSPSGFLTVARVLNALQVAAVDANTSASRSASCGEGSSSVEEEGLTSVQSSVKKQIQNRLLAPIPLRPAVNTTVQIEVAELQSLLSLESRPLASVAVTGLTFEASRDQWWERGDDNAVSRYSPAAKAAPGAQENARTTGWPGWSLIGGLQASAYRYVRSRLHGLSVLDLTPDGQLHHEVVSHVGASETMPSVTAAVTSTSGTPEHGSNIVWKSAAPTTAATAAERLPVVVIDYVPAHAGERSAGEVNAYVRGLRVCLLRRFITEVAKYFGPAGLGPVFALNFGVDVGGAGISESDTIEQQEEDAAVVIGEEDTMIPDDWSVLSGKSGTGGGTRTDNSAGVQYSENVEHNAKQSGATLVPGDGSVDDSSDFASQSIRVTAVLGDVTVVLPRNTHSREAAAVHCDELVVEVSEGHSNCHSRTRGVPYP